MILSMQDWLNALTQKTPETALAEIESMRRQVNIELTRKAFRSQHGIEAWMDWLLDIYPSYFSDTRGRLIPFALCHIEFWRHVSAIPQDRSPRSFLAVWSRDFGKSTNAELAAVKLGADRIRKYCWYICATQDQADDHVQNISGLLESPRLAERYPAMSEREVSKFGGVRGWRVNRLWTQHGFICDAVGLDTAARGSRLMEQRPDLMIFDDIDDDSDSSLVVDKKLDTMSRGILPAGARENLAVIFPQNRIWDDSCMARILDRRTDILSDRIISGPHPAIYDLKYKQTPEGTELTQGRTSWPGFSLDMAQATINRIGIRAFLAEYQHDEGAKRGKLWNQPQIDQTRQNQAPRLVRIGIGVDPPSGVSQGASEAERQQAAECGIVVAGLGEDGRGYVLMDASEVLTPDQWGGRVVDLYATFRANWVVAERNNGGDMVGYVIESKDPMVPVELVWAARGKITRAEPISVLYEKGRISHVGQHPELERQMVQYDGQGKSPDRLDALVWILWKLMVEQNEDLPNLNRAKHGVSRKRRKAVSAA